LAKRVWNEWGERRDYDQPIDRLTDRWTEQQRDEWQQVRESTSRVGGTAAADRLEAGEFGERKVEILADSLVFLLLAEQLVCIHKHIGVVGTTTTTNFVQHVLSS